MSDQQFCLRWNNHQSTLVSVFDTLLENNVLVDCTLAAEGQFLKAHKVVLCACSPYLELLLSQHYEKHPILILKDVKFQELKSMMDYMYKGEVNISQDQLGTFLKAAESLQIKGLTDGTGDDSRDVGSTQPKRHEPPRKATHNQQPRSPAVLPHASSGLTIEPRRSTHDVPDSPIRSREGSTSPTPRKRRRPRRPSQGEDYETSYDNGDSQNTAIVPSTNQVTSTPNAIPKIQPPDTDENDELNRIAEAGLIKEKTEPPSEFVEPKMEAEEPPVDDNVEDLTLDDDDELDGMDMGAGPSHSNDNSNQGYGWGLSDRNDDMYLSQDGIAQRDNQDDGIPMRKKRGRPIGTKKRISPNNQSSNLIKRGRGRPLGTKKIINQDEMSSNQIKKPRGRPMGSGSSTPKFAVRADYQDNSLHQIDPDMSAESTSTFQGTGRKGRPRNFLSAEEIKNNAWKIWCLIEEQSNKHSRVGKRSVIGGEDKIFLIKNFLKSPFITHAQAKMLSKQVPLNSVQIESWFERTRFFVKKGLDRLNKYEDNSSDDSDSNCSVVEDDDSISDREQQRQNEENDYVDSEPDDGHSESVLVTVDCGTSTREIIETELDNVTTFEDRDRTQNTDNELEGSIFEENHIITSHDLQTDDMVVEENFGLERKNTESDEEDIRINVSADAVAEQGGIGNRDSDESNEFCIVYEKEPTTSSDDETVELGIEDKIDRETKDVDDDGGTLGQVDSSSRVTKLENLLPSQIERIKNIVQVFGHITPRISNYLSGELNVDTEVILQWYKSIQSNSDRISDSNDIDNVNCSDAVDDNIVSAIDDDAT